MRCTLVAAMIALATLTAGPAGAQEHSHVGAAVPGTTLKAAVRTRLSEDSAAVRVSALLDRHERTRGATMLVRTHPPSYDVPVRVDSGAVVTGPRVLLRFVHERGLVYVMLEGRYTPESRDGAPQFDRRAEAAVMRVVEALAAQLDREIGHD